MKSSSSSWPALLSNLNEAVVPTRAPLERDGAVILTGLPPEPDSLPLAAAEVLGVRLSRLHPVRERGSDRDDRI